MVKIIIKLTSLMMFVFIIGCSTINKVNEERNKLKSNPNPRILIELLKDDYIAYGICEVKIDTLSYIIVKTFDGVAITKK